MQDKIQYQDYNSLLGMIKSRSCFDNFFIIDNINSLSDSFNLNVFFNFPIRLGMVLAILCKRGYTKVRIGLEDFIVEKTKVLVVLPDQIFEIMEVSDDFEAGYILLEKDFFDVRNDFKMALDLHSHFLKQPCVTLPEKEMKEGLSIFNLIKEKMEENANLFQKEIVQTYIRILFYIVCNMLLKTNSKHIRTRKEEIFEEFIALLNQNFRKQQNVNWYAEKFFITPKYLSKLVFDVSGKHASEWIKDYVILEAKALLNSSTLTVQQISDELSFNNQSHFGTYFKRYTGISPREYKHGKRKS